MRAPTAIKLMTALALAGCGGTPTGVLTMAEVAGAYSATTFESVDNEVVTNQLALGGSIAVTLTAGGQTSGRLIVIGGAVNGGDFEADLAGTWTLNGTAAILSHESDSFLRDIVFAYDNGTLRGSRFADGVTVRVVLTR